MSAESQKVVQSMCCVKKTFQRKTLNKKNYKYGTCTFWRITIEQNAKKYFYTTQANARLILLISDTCKT